MSKMSDLEYDLKSLELQYDLKSLENVCDMAWAWHVKAYNQSEAYRNSNTCVIDADYIDNVKRLIKGYKDKWL